MKIIILSFPSSRIEFPSVFITFYTQLDKNKFLSIHDNDILFRFNCSSSINSSINVGFERASFCNVRHSRHPFPPDSPHASR